MDLTPAGGGGGGGGAGDLCVASKGGEAFSYTSSFAITP